jgi:NADH-quinone oxidoreductase subunit A
MFPCRCNPVSSRGEEVPADVGAASPVPFRAIGLGDSGCRPVLVDEATVAGAGMMDAWLVEYLPILVFFGIAVVIAGLAVGGSWLTARQNPDAEKAAPYECGFEPFTDSRTRFDVRFYLVSILFIIFDLEIAFLFPWAITLGKIGLFGFWSMVVFLAVLTVGFIYEWRKGALEWE